MQIQQLLQFSKNEKLTLCLLIFLIGKFGLHGDIIGTESVHFSTSEFTLENCPSAFSSRSLLYSALKILPIPANILKTAPLSLLAVICLIQVEKTAPAFAIWPILDSALALTLTFSSLDSCLKTGTETVYDHDLFFLITPKQLVLERGFRFGH